uniref:Coatomer subunit beta n=1 Tax=Astyanax mexicanus TaxID=7994 RepID=A0A8B9HG14_ASTMX
MTAAENVCYTLINVTNDSEPPSEVSLKADLEKGEIKAKTEALKKVIIMILNGEKLPGLLMTIIRFVLPLQDHTIKKLLLVFWEIVPKTTPDGKLLQEMILVCDAYRKDLQHPNEFIRGSTLRFLCKLKESELLEPLMPAIRACLEHRHSYVRRNAVLAIYTIYRNFENLIPDAPELIHDFLVNEKDASCKRNAFMMLIHADQDRALDYLSTCIDQVHTFGDILQLVIVELIYKVCHANPSERARFIRCIYNLLQSSSPAVKYEAAGTLVTLSSAPTAIKAAAQCYIDLIIKESDNNVKLIVLDRLIELKEHPTHERVLQDLVMDILRVLTTPDLEVRKKTLQLALDLVSSRNVEELVIVLKKEVIKTNNVTEHEDTDKYRQLLVRTLHSCSVRFPDMAANVIPVLMEFLSDTNEAAAADVLEFVREAIQRFDNLRPLIIEKMLEVFHAIKTVKIYRGALWILGEYCSTKDDIQSVMTEVRRSLGEVSSFYIIVNIIISSLISGFYVFCWVFLQVTQLTGFSDPVYAEAYVHVNQYDIVLDVLVVNQTSDTLQNCTLELATLGIKTLNEKAKCINACSLFNTDIIMGWFAVYDVSGAASDRNCVVLSDIHIDIMDYIQPASCTDAEFRQMWAEFEWENKVRNRLYTLETKRLLGLCSCMPIGGDINDAGFFAAIHFIKLIFGSQDLLVPNLQVILNVRKLSANQF